MYIVRTVVVAGPASRLHYIASGDSFVHLGHTSSALGSNFHPEVKRGRPPTAHAYKPFSLFRTE